MARLLDRLQAANMTNRGIQTWAQRVCEQIEAAFADIADQVADIAAAQAAADAAQTDADAAQTDATDALADAATAQTTADTVLRDHAIATSYIYPGEVLTAADVGASVTITVAQHVRRYGDIADVTVNSGTITGLNFSQEYFVYYTQTSRAGGTVTYAAVTNPNSASPGKAAGRHFVGAIVTPADGAANTTGGMGMTASGLEITRTKIGGTG